jgi:Rps23 Pro-64 3,4-dihydroxylase Tpa1-like proline 4-hydroxylase
MANYDETDLTIHENVFCYNDYVQIIDYISRPCWRFGHGSYPKNHKKYQESFPFWVMELDNEEFFSNHLLSKITNLIDKKVKLVNVYANGHTYGTKAILHQDWSDPSGITFLYYPNNLWKLEWGGKTLFKLDEDKYYFNIPKPNSAILFPGEIWHCAEETSRSFSGLRVTIAWKLLLED